MGKARIAPLFYRYTPTATRSLVITKEERSYRFGPGRVIDGALYDELVKRKFVLAEWFEPAQSAELVAAPQEENED